MSWDESYYKRVRLEVLRKLNTGETKPHDYIAVFKSLAEDQDYEAAKATRDGVYDWLERKRLPIAYIAIHFCL